MPAECLAPILVPRLLDDPSIFRELIERHSPYFPVQRYFSGNAEYSASSGQGGINIIAPNFRGDWAYDEPLVDGAEIFLEHPRLVAAARELFATEHVRPQQVYTNLTWQLPFAQGGGHTDVPAFRGIDRTAYPITFLSLMGHSRLFEEERINIATAVAWFYQGEDGGFEYWPDGPESPSKLHEGRVFNTAIVGDNDRMFHRVRPVGRTEDGLLPDMTLDTRLEHLGGDDWRIADGDRTRAELRYERLRISVSWKAEVFRDAAEQRLVDEHRDDLAIDEVLDRLLDDLARRGLAAQRPTEPASDPEFIDLLSRAYRREPGLAATSPAG